MVDYLVLIDNSSIDSEYKKGSPSFDHLALMKEVIDTFVKSEHASLDVECIHIKGQVPSENDKVDCWAEQWINDNWDDIYKSNKSCNIVIDIALNLDEENKPENEYTPMEKRDNVFSGIRLARHLLDYIKIKKIEDFPNRVYLVSNRMNRLQLKEQNKYLIQLMNDYPEKIFICRKPISLIDKNKGTYCISDNNLQHGYFFQEMTQKNEESLRRAFASAVTNDGK